MHLTSGQKRKFCQLLFVDATVWFLKDRKWSRLGQWWSSSFMWSSCADLRSLCLVAGVKPGRNLNGDRQVLTLVSWYVSRGLQLMFRDSSGWLGWFRDHHPSGSADRKLPGKYRRCGV